MSSTKNTYQYTLKFIAEILCTDNSTQNLEKKLIEDDIDWDQFVKLSSQHLVLTTSYCRLKQIKLLNYLPKELENYLEKITSINRNRNLTLLAEIKDIAKCLSDNNIPYVFLKGAALLIGNYCKDLGERMVADLDILIPKEHIQKAFKLIKSMGYNLEKDFNYDVKNFRHLARQFSNDKMAVIELHHSVLNTNYSSLINLQELFNTSIKINNMFIPNTYYLNLTTIFGIQINSNAYRYKQWFLRSLSDSLILQVYNENKLIEDFTHDKIVKDYFSKLHAIFDCVEKGPHNKSLTNQIRGYQFRIKHIGFHKLLHKIKFIGYNITERIALMTYNKSYRKHLLKTIRTKLNY